MRTMIRAAIAVVTIIFLSNYLEDPANLSKIEDFKNQIVYSDSVQSMLNSAPIEQFKQFNPSDIMPSEFF
ncbi:hypothetical protein [Staphylococcus canis]|uniref:Uncharacterized protein n=1 Tax=Staphylococcus canis TaxID=2724942 RepID=A0ABS0T6W0_9STAP|nr:hypothetical protein [Staphylococcus canis]MBI5974485.1 hypothetical protein [Staphylococcus canis]